MRGLKERFKKEAESFNKIAKNRFNNGKIPDMQKDFFNPYFYNNIWRNSHFVRQDFGASAKKIINILKQRGVISVIEFGCGDGWLCLELARTGFKVKGFDISSENIKIAREYLNSLKEKKRLDLSYSCGNVLNYKGRIDSVVCYGFLHHLPPDALNEFIGKIASNMKKNQILIAVEPRYDKVNLKTAIMIYGLRRILPNHFQYDNFKNIEDDLDEIMKDLKQADKAQSELDNESTSSLILDTIKSYFNSVNTGYTNAFYDKIIGSIRVNKTDEERLSKLLKTLDDIIVKYSNDIARRIEIIASDPKRRKVK